MSRKYIVQTFGPVVVPLSIAVSTVLSSSFLQQQAANKNDRRVFASALTTIKEQIDRERSDVAFSTHLPIDGYHPKDTLLFYKSPISLEHIELYDNIVKKLDFYLVADTDLLNQLVNFRRRDKWLIDNYNAQQTDSARLVVKDGIYKQLSYEREILVAEISFFKEKISRDSLQFVRDTSFRRYL